MPSAEHSGLDDELAASLAARQFDRAAELLARGAEVNRVIRREETFDRDVVEESSTYLADAAIAGDIDRVTFLLEHGADPNIVSLFSNRTALLEATRFGQVAVIDLLLARGADVSAIESYSKQNSLGYATGSVDVAIVRALLEAGAKPVFRRLGFSVKGGAEAREVVRLLVEHGGDINEVDDWGRTPLMWAAEYAEAETVARMIELGAEVNRVSVANMNGVQSHETALGLARKRKRGEVVALVLQLGAREVGGRHSAGPSLWQQLRRMFVE